MGRAEINAIVRQQLLKMTEYYIGFEAPGSSSPSTHIYIDVSLKTILEFNAKSYHSIYVNLHKNQSMKTNPPHRFYFILLFFKYLL